MRHTFQTEQWVPYPVELVFAFFANPENLPRLMPPWQHARIERASYATPPAHGAPADGAFAPSQAAGAGSTMTISFRPVPFSPIRMRWDAQITEFVWNSHFCDVQRERGPFAYWHHCHRVSAQSREGVAGTMVVDDLEYEPPFGPLGELAHTVGLRRQIESIFAYRQRHLPTLLARLTQN